MTGSDPSGAGQRRVRVAAPAKINLGLEVLGLRPDGYHEIVTVLQAIRLTDTIGITLSEEPGIRLRVEPRGLDLGPAEENLAVRAARLVPPGPREPPGVEIRLRKRIPVGAGLGGGSSDAMAVLVGLRRLRGLPVDEEETLALGARLGSDVPFFFRGGTQLGTGRGELVRPLPPWPAGEILLVYPRLSITASSIYGAVKLKLTPQGPLSTLVSCNFLGGIRGADWYTLRNDLEPAVLEAAPAVGRLLKEFQSLGSDFARVTGSGSCVFGTAPSHGTALAWAEHFRNRGHWSMVVRPSRRGCCVR